jgi:hypothetical protein
MPSQPERPALVPANRAEETKPATGCCVVSKWNHKTEAKMADDKSKAGKADRDRINVSEDYELRDWAEHFGVSPETLKAAVSKAGPMVKDVAKQLGKST